jgi:hypothetical protein
MPLRQSLAPLALAHVAEDYRIDTLPCRFSPFLYALAQR